MCAKWNADKPIKPLLDANGAHPFASGKTDAGLDTDPTHPQGKKSMLTLFAAFFVLLGLALVLGGAFHLNKQYHKVQQSTRTIGTVIENVSERSKNRSVLYRAVIAFQAHGQTYQFDDTIRARPPRFHVGQNVTVHFNPTQPAQTAGILRFFDIYLGSFILLIIGANCTLISGLILGRHALLQWLHGM